MTNANSNSVMAKVLVDRYGDGASREAAKRERKASESGHEAEAKDWRRVRILLSEGVR